MKDLIQQIQNFASDNAQNLYQRICDAKVEEENAPTFETKRYREDISSSLLCIGLGVIAITLGGIFYLFCEADWLVVVGFLGVLFGLFMAICSVFAAVRINNPDIDKDYTKKPVYDYSALREQILTKVGIIIERTDKDWNGFVVTCKDKAQAIINASSLSEEKKVELRQKISYSHKLNLTKTKLRHAMLELDRDDNYIVNVNTALQNYAATVKRIYRETADKQVEVYREIESALK